MNRKIKNIVKKYLCIIVALLLIMLGGLAFYRNVTSNALNMTVDTFSSDAAVFTGYVDDMLQARLMRLEDLAVPLADTVQTDRDRTDKILKQNRVGFDQLMILNLEGKREQGDKVQFDLEQDDLLTTLVNQRESQIYSTLVKDAEMNRYVMMCAPILRGSSVVAVLAGAVRLEQITEMVDKWCKTQDGCAFILTTDGEYITEGEEFEEMLGEEASNFFTYLSNCSIKNSGETRDSLEQSMKDRKEAVFSYTYNREGYAGVLHPSAHGNWYVGYVKMDRMVTRHAMRLDSQTVILGIVSFVLCLLLMIYLGVSLYRIETLREYQARQEFLNALERSIVFEFSFFPKELRFYGDGEAMFGHKLHTLYGEEVYEVYNSIHPDDASVRGRIHQFYDDDANIFQAEVRIKNRNGYGWYRIAGKLMKDKRYGFNQKFVGKIANADQEIAEEKDLVERAENDLLTGILNKKTMEEKVVQCLQNVKGSIHCIFFMVDLDNFKNVNDKLGHISGDKAIVDTADRLREIFPKDAYVGRLGGDEFAVCALYDAFDEESLHNYIKKKAEKICEVNRRTYRNGEIEVNISSSVGIALAPEQATQFEELYRKADSALYQSKNGGKNCFHMYQG